MQPLRILAADDPTIEGRKAVRMWMDDILKHYGKTEGNLIVGVAFRRISESNGGTVRDWYAALQAAILERHPETDATAERVN